MGCITHPKYSIFINGRPGGWIQTTRGIRQGYPLSPFLFLLVSKVLSSLIARLHDRGVYEGFRVGRDKIHVSILQYADDTLIFCKDDDDMLAKLKEIIDLYEWCSGQKVNWEKSALVGVNMEEQICISAAANLNCKVGNLPFSYLGLLLGGYPKKMSFWQPVIDKIQFKLDKWKRYNLSRGGRAILCKSVLANIPSYYMSSFLMPNKVIKLIEQSMRNFFLGRVQRR